MCDATVALGSTSQCDIPAGGGTARYTFTVPSDDTIRYRVAIPVGTVVRSMSLTTTGGAELCAANGYGAFDCAVPAGTYRLEVTVADAGTAYTSIDGVLAASCGPSPDLRVGAPGFPADVAVPGASVCRTLDAVSGDVLDMVLDVNGDQGLRVRVYDAAGAAVCDAPAVTAFGRSTCTVSGGSVFRLFASPLDDIAQSATLIVTRVSDPSGCVADGPDGFGVAARTGNLQPHQQRCYGFSVASARRVGVALYGMSGPGRTLSWRARDAAGTVLCSGELTDIAHPLAACALPAAGEYTLFVSALAREVVRYAVTFVDLTSDAGCAALPSTGWDQDAVSGSLDTRGAADCFTFTAGEGDIVHPDVRGQGNVADGLLVNDRGTVVCGFRYFSDCTIPATGPYRVVISAHDPDPTPYRVWVINRSSTAGCLPTTPDRFGTAPTRTAQFDGDNLAVCYAVRAAGPATDFATQQPVTGGALVSPAIRSVDGSFVCTSMACTVPQAGTYLYALQRNDDPSGPGTSRASLYRVDRVSNCPTVRTTFSAPAVRGRISAPAAADCHQFNATAGDRMYFRGTPRDYTVQHEVFDSAGNPTCFGPNSGCTLDGPGPYRIVSFARAAPAASYTFRIVSLTAAVGCAGLTETRFGRAPARTYAVPDPVALDWFKITVAEESGRFAVRLTGLGRFDETVVTAYTPQRFSTCAVFDDFVSCPISGAGSYLLVVSSQQPAAGTIGWYDLTRSAGCRAGPSLAFGQAPTPATIAARGAVACLTVPYQQLDYARLAFVPSRAPQVVGGLMNGQGESVCDLNSGYTFLSNCRLGNRVGGPFRVVLYALDSQHVRTGQVALHAWRLNEPTGCTDIGSLRDGFGPLVGTLSDANDVACYAGTAAAGTYAVTTANDDVPADVPLAQLVPAGGVVRCSVVGSGSCTIGSGQYAILVQKQSFRDDFTGTYRVTGERTG